MTMYLAVVVDRHSDDEYKISKDLNKLRSWCREQQTQYENEVWSTPEWASISHEFLYYKDAGYDDGPKVYIQEVDEL